MCLQYIFPCIFARMRQESVVKLGYDELVDYADNFSESNYVGCFQFGKFYHGKMEFCRWTRYMMVKIWEVPETYKSEHGDNDLRLMACCFVATFHILIYPGELTCVICTCAGRIPFTSP